MADGFTTEKDLVKENRLLREKAKRLEHDLQDARLREKNLMREAGRLQSLIFSNKDAIISSDIERRITECNPAFLRMFGYERQEVIGRSLACIYPSEECYLQAGRRLYPIVRSEGYWRGQLLLARKDGRELLCEVTLSAHTQLDGRTTGYVAAVRDVTERERVAAALRKSENRYRSLLDNIEDGFFETDLKGRITFFNRVLPKITGREPETLKGMDFLRLITASTAADIQARFSQTGPTERPACGTEYEVEIKGDETRTIQSSIFPILDDQGRTSGFRGLVRDITERIKSEFSLRESEAKFNTAFLSNPAAISINRLPNGVYVDINPAFTRMYGYEREEVVGRTSEGMNIWADHPDRVRERMDLLLSEGSVKDWEFAFNRKNGDIGFGLNYGEIIELGGAPHILSFSLDITVRKRNEALIASRLEAITRPPGDDSDLSFSDLFDLEEIQKIQDAFADATNVGALISSPDGRPLTRPSNFTHLCMDLIRGTPEGAARCMHSSSVLGKKSVGGPVVQRCLSAGLWEGGASIWVGDKHIANWLVGQIRVEGEDEEKILAFAREIGVDEEEYRKAFYQVPKVSLERFERITVALSLIASQLSTLARQNVRQARAIHELDMAQEETRRLERQLQQSQKMEAVGTLASGIAHDFNNILQAISGYVQILEIKDRSSLPETKYYSEIDRSIQRASDLVQRLLTFGRKVEPELKPLDINETVDHILEILERTIPKMIRIETHLAPDLWKINADLTQLERILMNLATNARDAMPDGGRLLIETENTELDGEYCRGLTEVHPGRYVTLRVSDTGQGMPSDVIERIFEPFFTTKGVGEGTGLGMSTVYGIVKGHGGHITCYSEPGQGAVFKVYFPAIEGGNIVTEDPAAPVADMLSGGDELILIVDDDESISEIAASILRQNGYRILTAPSGEEALKLYFSQGDRIDLVLLDIGMPGMGGHACLQELLELDPRARVIIASGYSVNGHLKDAIQSGARAFISKPYRLADMLRTVREVLDAEPDV